MPQLSGSTPMQRQCPKCGTLDVRRSCLGDDTGPAQTAFRSRYRCRRCSELFWVISARTYRIAGYVLGVNLVVVALMAMLVAAYGF
jgi:hypothetical protein